MNIRIQVTPELRVRLAHTDCLVVELPPEISTALEGREELMKSLTAADVPTDGEALRVERDLLSAKCDEQAQRIRELERDNSKLSVCGDAACARVKQEVKAVIELAAHIKSLREVITEFRKSRVTADRAMNELVYRDSLELQHHLSAHDAELAKAAFVSGATDAAAFISQKIQQGESVIDLDAGKAADKYVADLLAKAGE